MKKKTVKPDRICFECLHYEACQSWNIGSLVNTAADNCVNYRASLNRWKNEAADSIKAWSKPNSRIRIVHNDGTVGGYHAVVMSAEIKDAPTIIPAEEGET